MAPWVCCDAVPSQVKPWKIVGKRTTPLVFTFCISSLTFLETEMAFHLEMRTKGMFHISRGGKWKFNLKIVIDEKSSFLCLLACVVISPT